MDSSQLAARQAEELLSSVSSCSLVSAGLLHEAERIWPLRRHDGSGTACGPLRIAIWPTEVIFIKSLNSSILYFFNSLRVILFLAKYCGVSKTHFVQALHPSARALAPLSDFISHCGPTGQKVSLLAAAQDDAPSNKPSRPSVCGEDRNTTAEEIMWRSFMFNL